VALGLAILLAPPVASPADRGDVVLATTTSTQDSGLLDVLVPVFERTTGYRVKTVAVGTGGALRLGAEGNADVVLVHAPELELEYLKRGALIDRRRVMHNDFVLVGPPGDPAGIRSLGPARAAVAFRQIARIGARFVSRGDRSGTHLKEQALWKAVAVTPTGDWYIESGQAMGATLILASEKRAYTLTDRATYLAFRSRVDLVTVADGDPALRNVYHVLRPDPTQRSRVHLAGGRAFEDFLVSPAAQALIAAFGVQRYGVALFIPDAGGPEPR
jgi:tungstate transport system substrate-binding protein